MTCTSAMSNSESSSTQVLPTQQQPQAATGDDGATMLPRTCPGEGVGGKGFVASGQGLAGEAAGSLKDSLRTLHPRYFRPFSMWDQSQVGSYICTSMQEFLHVYASHRGLEQRHIHGTWSWHACTACLNKHIVQVHIHQGTECENYGSFACMQGIRSDKHGSRVDYIMISAGTACHSGLFPASTRPAGCLQLHVHASGVWRDFKGSDHAPVWADLQLHTADQAVRLTSHNASCESALEGAAMSIRQLLNAHR